MIIIWSELKLGLKRYCSSKVSRKGVIPRDVRMSRGSTKGRAERCIDVLFRNSQGDQATVNWLIVPPVFDAVYVRQ